MADLEKLKEQLEEKNTYMHYYKQEEVKQIEKQNELAKTNVIILYLTISYVFYSSHMIKLRETLRQTTARSASTRASGVSTDRKEKMPSRN